MAQQSEVVEIPSDDDFVYSTKITQNGAVVGTNDHKKAVTQKPDLLVWPGWVELESEPAYFNVMLQDMGVTGIKVTEVFGLEPEDLAFLPQPVHALIFLFKYKPPTRKNLHADFPPNVWFARQVPHNACATYALLNIVNNLPNVQLGVKLQQFRAATLAMNPLEKGDQIDQLDYVRAIHNSFATHNDIIAMDDVLKRDIDKARKQEAAIKLKRAREARAAANEAKKAALGIDVTPAMPSRASERLKNGVAGVKRKPDDDQTATKRIKINGKPKTTPSRKSIQLDEAAYHFCAYMPIGDKVWKLDGLEPTPEEIGDTPANGSWLDVAVPALQTCMLLYDADNIDFNLMAVVQDALVSHKNDLIRNVKVVGAVEEKLTSIVEDWREMEQQGNDEYIAGVSEQHHITQDDLSEAPFSEQDAMKLKDLDEVSSLLDFRTEIMSAQPALRAAVRDELESAKQDGVKAFHKRFDYGSFVRSWMEELLEVEVIGDLLQTVTA